jgi:hypothetical protein
MIWKENGGLGFAGSICVNYLIYKFLLCARMMMKICLDILSKALNCVVDQMHWIL